MFQRILIAVDDCREAGYAVDVGARLATALEADVALVHVIDPDLGVRGELSLPIDELRGEAYREAMRLLDKRDEHGSAPAPAEHMVRLGEPAREIVRAAEEFAADLIVIGTTGRGRLAEFLLGSTAEDVIRRAPCPVMAVRQQPRPASSAGDLRESTR